MSSAVEGMHYNGATPSVRKSYIISTDVDIQYGGGCTVLICHTIRTEQEHDQYGSGCAVRINQINKTDKIVW